MLKRLLWVGAAVLALALATSAWWLHRSPPFSASTEFARRVNRGNAVLEQGDFAAAIALYTEAQSLSPQSVDVRLNLANACLLADRPADAAIAARQALELDPNNAAAYYLLGCALLRQNQPEPAAAAFQQSWKIEPGLPALDFQMGMAQRALGHVPDAIGLFESVVRADPTHPSAHYQLSQLYRRAGRTADADRELQEHQKIQANLSPATTTTAALEKCKHTQLLAPFILAEPARDGVAVRFTDATATAFGPAAADLRAPLAALDYARDGRRSLFAREQSGGFVVLDNRAGRFAVLGRPLRALADNTYRAALVGDLDNDGVDDVIVLGEQGSHVFKFTPQGRFRDATRAAGLEGLKATSGLLADLDFTGNLDLAVTPTDGSGLGLYRNLGNFFFDAAWADSGLPRSLAGATQLVIEDWTNEGLPGVFVARTGATPAFFAKQRAGAYTANPLADAWPAGSVLATGDLDNDLRAEAVIATASSLELIHRDAAQSRRLPLSGFVVSRLLLVDYDNDGWLDLLAAGPSGLRVWRNAGHAGLTDVTTALGLDRVGAVVDLVAADFDNDGDTDLIVATPTGLRLLRNDGGNQNRQLKLRLAGNRSNSGALGVRVELVAGNWRTRRTVREIPTEIGVGAATKLDALRVHWFDLSTAQVDVPLGADVLAVTEPTLPSGSCPYLYAWDGQGFRFVNDMLGAAPLGLPATEKFFVPADPEELLALGNEKEFPPHNGAYEVRLTDELREVLYLDEAHLIAIDHPVGTVVHPTSKMLPKPPFPKHELWTLRPLAVPQHATRNDGLDVTAALARVDRVMAGPVQLRRPQLRGLAEPYALTLDFGPLAVDRPLVLALTGWIHFGGGMANIAGSIDPTLPFPFPSLEVELADGTWQKVDVVVGTPAGKTKTILVDLEHKLPAGARRLRLSTAYEIYWDAAELCEKANPSEMASREHHLLPTRTDLHWRGYGRPLDLPPSQPLTPSYTDVSPTPPWDHTPGGWFTRYGPVDDLVTKRDDRLALLGGGDELALAFDASALPPPSPGMTRDFFLHVVGWDKDADFHIAEGWRLEPFPYSGMNDQTYGREPRPAHLDDTWIKDYNTRWVDPVIVQPAGPRRSIP